MHAFQEEPNFYLAVKILAIYLMVLSPALSTTDMASLT